MADFQEAFELAVGSGDPGGTDEGGYANDPEDRGGETYRGIARSFHAGWAGWSVIDAAKAKKNFPDSLYKDARLQAMMQDFYYKNFWVPGHYGQLEDQAIANKVFSLALTNPLNTHKALQHACRYLGKDPGAIDGRIGPKTLAAANSCRGRTLLLAFQVCMGAYYLSLNNQYYILGWLERTFR